MKEAKRVEEKRMKLRPEPMPQPAVHFYEWNDEGKYPDVIRLSFSDGHTEIYDRRIKQPGPKRYLNIPKHQRKDR